MRARLEDLKQTAAGIAWDSRESPLTDRDELAHALHLLRECKRYLSDAERTVEAQLAENLGDEKVAVVAGLGSLERKAAPIKPRWDHQGLTHLLAARSRDERVLNETTGEIEGEAEAALRVLLDCAAVSYWRRGKLKERGIDPNAFQENEGWRSTVRVIPSES